MNFSFLADKWPLLAEMGDLAEKNLYHDPNTSLIKLRMFGETIAKYLLAYENIKDPEDGKPISRLNILAAKGVIPDRLLPLFHSIRKNGNRATHEAFGSVEAYFKVLCYQELEKQNDNILEALLETVKGTYSGVVADTLAETGIGP